MNEINTLMALLATYEIRIPIIQRDYAQGRNTKKAKEVRKNLISDFKNCLSEEGKNIDFNFIYGTISEGVFYPVDGQQRLTSLYLLHWYLYCQIDDDKMSELKSFSYMTRNSASAFFAMLKEPSEDFKLIAKETESFRKDVEEKSWFQIEWKYDPTVSAALNFLDDLSKDTDFKKNAKYYLERLINNAITFSFIEEQVDNAEIKAAKNYIRMNARGKVLESFENLKAMIDSIDGKLGKTTNIISDYDRNYINALYSFQAKDSNLNQKTEEINRMSICCLKNIYNLCAQLKSRNCVKEEHDFISKIYEDSQNSELNKDDEDFYYMFFSISKAVFDYCCKNKENNIEDDNIKDIWEDKGEFTASENQKSVAAILYVYYYSNKQKEIVEKDEVIKFIYVLENLKYTEWEDFFNNINQFSMEIANSTDVFTYFNKRELSKQLNEKCGLNDINVRIKEQIIKSKIINDQKLEWHYFKELEVKSKERKIQYLLYISGYWNNEGDYSELEKYIGILKQYYNNIEWLKIYAVTTNIQTNPNEVKLEEPSKINKNAGETHIWKNDFYYWNDAVDEILSNTIQLDNIKKAYDNLDSIKTIITNLSSEEDYKKCWLTYAIKHVTADDAASSLLLENKLEYKEGKVYILEKNNYYRYDMCVLKICKKATKGLNDFTVNAEGQYEFKPNGTYKYQDGHQNGYKLETGNNARILRLLVPIKITGVNEKHKEESCLHKFNDNNKTYTIYHFENEEYSYKEYEYQLDDVLTKRDVERGCYNELLSQIKKNDYILIYNKQTIKIGDKEYSFKKIGQKYKYKHDPIPCEFNGKLIENTKYICQL